MPNVTRGTRMAGLLAYLVGPGRANEHTEPHLVAGDAPMLSWHDDNELDHDSAMAIAAYLDRPRTAYDVEVTGGHVWHCSLSLRAEEGLLPDEQWAAIASDFTTAMGFDDNDGTKAPCRWVAVRHGVSKAGNDHIHLVVNLVREDGTRASVHRDFVRAQRAARDLEQRYGLEELESVVAQRSTRGYKPAEREAHVRRSDAAGRGSASTLGPRERLALKVRAAATASLDEAEFVRRLRREGVLVRARYADHGTDVVTGFSVAQRPRRGERPIWYGGLSLARDLTLPRLRAAHGWPDTPSAADAAVAEWTAARRGRRVVAPGRETATPSAAEWQRRSADLGDVVDQLSAVDVADADKWATVARSTAGMLAAWSNATEAEPGDLAAAAEALSRAAQTHRPTPPMPKAGRVGIAGAAMVLAAAAHSGQGRVAQAVMIRQLIRLAEALTRAAAAQQQMRLAQQLADDTRARLARVHAGLPTPVDVVATRRLDFVGRNGTGWAAPQTSPIPRTLQPHRARPRASAVRAGAER
ncbi:relaxase/mobilization nuclease domain-containing protein [Xylanimonas ulmi]|uniref:Relaxase/mobilization nuclease-like protein n=1 Tax=Xylanimonas ulmi TaxID=228973 RepID=A0A4Q7M2U6_9MICO|nr:relaxase/mobilization nuclease domain-containing protein [Xylanibacterium ulmi]RZS62216.1 relaxase/mobilization nuclease-like protein [Xylanibacterium ulmi]